MNWHRTSRLASASLAALALAACSDAPNRATSAISAPTVSPSYAVASSPVTVTTLKRTTPLPYDMTTTITLYNQGGNLSIPQAGIQVTIPRTAIPANKAVTISVTALKGDQVAYEFGPSGTVFSAPLSVTQDLSNTTWASNTGSTVLQASYFKARTDLSPTTGTANSYETIPADVMATGRRLHWDIKHFSGYIVSWARR